MITAIFVILIFSTLLLRRQSNKLCPYWSHLGNALVSISNFSGVKQLNAFQFKSNRFKWVFKTDQEAENPAWSPKVDRTYGDVRLVFFLILISFFRPLFSQVDFRDTSPMWSFDGKSIVFSSNRAGNFNIYMMGAFGGNLVEIVSHDSLDTTPAYLPDNSVIFSSTRNGGQELFKLDASTSETFQLTSFDSSRQDRPQFNASLGGIYFNSRFIKKNTTDIFYLSLKFPQIYQLTFSRKSDDWGALSPMGNKLLFGTNRTGVWEIYLRNLESNSEYQITTTPKGSYSSAPSFAPDGNRFVYHSNKSGNSEIYLFNLETDEEINLTKSNSDNWLPDWSKDGQLIVFVSNRDGGKQRIFRMNSDGSQVMQLTF